MKKMLIYLLLIACFESFVSAASCYCIGHKDLLHNAYIDVADKDKALQQGDNDSETYPLNIFGVRYF